MDPTKPILDLYKNSSYGTNQRAPSQRGENDFRVQSSTRVGKSQSGQKEYSYNELKERYQELFTAYNQKTEKYGQIESELQECRSENNRLKQELQKMESKNQNLTGTLMAKNTELEDAYRSMQNELKKGPRSKKEEDALKRLEEGLEEAINSNFGLLREATFTQMNHFIVPTNT